ncbi:hypothetical protein E5353_11400 [Bacteroides caecimuris]|uniref:MoxR domain-containing protein n=1 Tax=Bacteroides caecimuris TaxID=1796613 RepID=A0A4S2CVZ7_9BACE|nr:hypothetical protein E5353_11400 [Bacteroides caecimuris]
MSWQTNSFQREWLVMSDGDYLQEKTIHAKCTTLLSNYPMRKVKEKSLFIEPLAIKEYIAKLIELISEGLFEKQHIMSVALLSAITGESIFLPDPPRTAKSMVARRLKLVFKGAKSFEYLMSRFSTPDEIFGPISISKLKNEDK